MTSDASSPSEPLSGPALADAYLEHLRGGGLETPEGFLASRGSASDEALELLRIVSHLTEEEPFHLYVGQVLGPYRIEEQIGIGGMGTVYRATAQAQTAGLAADTQVALKVIHPHLLSRPGFFKRFLREAEVGKRVRHENVVAALDVDATEVDGWVAHYLAMEHVEGRTLRELLREHGPVPEALLREIASQTVAGLTAIHAAGIVHRDLKPENILITDDHRVRVMDLGVARLLDETAMLTLEGQFAGTLPYAAPEQFRSGEVGPRADLYALGVVLYELASGENPFLRDETASVMRAHLDELPLQLADRETEISPFLSHLVATLLAKNPDERFAAASDLRAVLEGGERSEWWSEREQALRRARGHLPRIPVRRETRLHGRDGDLDLLQMAWRCAEEGDGNSVLLQGEAGIGKTRLVDTFLREHEGEDMHVLYGSYPPTGGKGGITDAILEHLGAADLEEALRPHLTVTPSLVGPLAALLRHEPPPDGAPSLQGDSLHAVLVHLMRGLAAEKPLLWVVDDLHFASSDSRKVLLSLARAVEGHRVLLLLATRPGLPEDDLAHFSRLENFQRRELARLGAREVIELLSDAFKSRALAEKLGGKIAYKSDGVPFFVFEMIRGLREGQFITELPDGSCVESKVIEDIEVPSAVRDLIEARLGDLTNQERAILDVAAVHGFEFDPDLIARALETRVVHVLQLLAGVERRSGVVQGAGVNYRFDHHQIQEVIYGGMHERLRAEYHGALAEARASREAVTAGDAGEADGDTVVFLAHHYLLGSRPYDAVPFVESALDHLAVVHGHDEAVTLANRALTVDGLLAGVVRVDVLLKENDCLDLLGRRAEQEAVLAEAVALARRTNDQATALRVLLALGRLRYATDSYEEAKEQTERALAIAREIGDRRGEAIATGDLGNVFHSQGRYEEARQHHERRVAIAREIGDRLGEASGTGNLGLVLLSLGRHEEAQQHHERELAIAREIGNLRREALALGSLGEVVRSFGRYEEAREHQERQLAIAREIGDLQQEADATGRLGLVFSFLGRFTEARERYERQLAIAREIGNRHGEVRATGNLGLVFASLGRYEEALEHTEGVLASAHELGSQLNEAVALVNLGPLWLSLGERDRALDALERSLAICREIGARYPEGYGLLSLAKLAAEKEQGEEARRLARESLELRREIVHGDGIADSLLFLGDLERRDGKAEAAYTVLEEALELSREQGRKAEVAFAQTLLALLPGGIPADAEVALQEAGDSGTTPQTRYYLWKATGKPEHLAEAKRLLDYRVEHAPEEYRESMVKNVRLHREIMEAWAEYGEASTA